MPKKPRQPHPWDRQVAANAVAYTACVFLGVGKYDTREFRHCADARAEARLMADGYGKPAMLYAVDKGGCSTHLENVDPMRRAQP